MVLVLVSLVLASSTPLTAPTTIDEVRVTGLWFSTEATVRRELPFSVGEVVTPEQWSLFETRLWNLGVFSRVELTLTREPGDEGAATPADGGSSPVQRTIATVTVEDRFPIAPIFRFNFGGGQFYLWAGVADINLFGRALEGRAFYERFGDQNGFHLHLLDPRFLNKRVAALIEGEWLSRPQPEYVVRRAAVRLAMDFNAPGFDDDRFRLGVRLEGNLDQLFSVPNGEQPLPVDSMALAGGPTIRFGRLDVDRIRLKRGFVEVRSDLIGSTDPTFPVANVTTLEAQYYWAIGSWLNVATRVLGGIELGARPQDRLYVGGLDKVRGYQYSEIRASSYATANAELRAIVFDSTWFAIMPVAFVDGGVARRDSGEAVPLLSAGAGLRLLVPRIYRFGVRFEVAFPFTGTRATTQFRPGINFGVWHFF